jgi:hypothetical protein
MDRLVVRIALAVLTFGVLLWLGAIGLDDGSGESFSALNVVAWVAWVASCVVAGMVFSIAALALPLAAFAAVAVYASADSVSNEVWQIDIAAKVALSCGFVAFGAWRANRRRA